MIALVKGNKVYTANAGDCKGVLKVKVIIKLRLLQREKSITSRMRILRKNKLDSRRNSQMTVILSSASVAEKVLAM